MEKFPVRLIAMDMDGTLLSEHSEIPQENLEAMAEAVKKGIRLAIVSGRMPGDISTLLSEAGIRDCFVLGLNGACCLDRPHGEIIISRYMDDAALDLCLSVLEEEQVTYSTFGRNHVAISRPFHTGKELQNWASNLERKVDLTYTFGLEGITSQRRLGTSKLVYIEREDPIRLARIREGIEKIPGVEVSSSWSDNIEIMPTGINKGSALKELSEKLHIDRSQVMALGDQDNDIPMLAWAGLGVAMGNASPGAREAAEFLTDTNKNAGVAKAIRRFALGQE